MLTWRWARGTRACIRSRGGGCSPAWWSSSGSSWRRTDQSGVSTAASWPITAHLGREGRPLQDHHKVGDVEVSCGHHTDNAARSLRSVTYHEVVVHNLRQDGEKRAKLWRGSKINILFYRQLCLPRTICSCTHCRLAFTLRVHCWLSSSHMEIWVISHIQCCQHSSNTVSWQYVWSAISYKVPWIQ